MKKRSLFILLTLVCMLAVLIPVTVSATVDDGWQEIDGHWYYGRDGQWVTDEVIKVGTEYYGFNSEGVMYDNEEFYCEGHWYRAKSGGALYRNAWYQDTGGYRFRYGEDAKALEDFQMLDGKWYFFYGDGSMAQDQAVWSNTYMRYYAISQDGTDSKELKLGWTQAFGDWYYVYDHAEWGQQLPYEEILEIDGVRYFFDSFHRMAANRVVWDDENEHYCLATSSGALLKNGWAQVDGKWYYAEDYRLMDYGFYNIDDNYYLFSNFIMYDLPGELEWAEDYYYVKPGGMLSKNEWYYDNTGDPYTVGWAYFGSDCRRVTGLQTIGGTTYYFSHYGVMQKNYVHEADDGVYVFDKDGKGTKVNGWIKHPESGCWMYAQADGLARGLVDIGGKTYAFYEDGEMVTGNYFNHYDPETETVVCYLFDNDGYMITTPGWKKLNGCWYYIVDKTGRLQEGWLGIGGKWYYFWPEMAHDTVFLSDSDNKYYAVDNKGVATELTGNGWKQLAWGRTYLENGKPVFEAWRMIGGAWYYFNEYCRAVEGGIYTIGGVDYVFDQNSKMVTNGWYRIGEDACYADGSGVAVTGLKTIGGKQYLFSEYGWLYSEGVYTYDEKYYWIDSDGSVRSQVTEGWNQIGGKWYYMQDEVMLRNKLLWLDGVCYGFGSDYAMCTDGIQYAWYDYYMFDKDGKLLTGWRKYDGKWYYADPESSDPYIYTYGIYEIDGKMYAFKDSHMQTGSLWIDGVYVETDSNGVVKEWVELKEGWNYVGDGYVYIKNGQWHTGWVGDYYVLDGRMQFGRELEYAGKIYWLGADGRYVKSGWIQDTYGDYKYAKAGGVLCSNEWLYLGGKYYYFEGTTMLRQTLRYIDGKYHEFDENGVWLGEYAWEEEAAPAATDGWKKIDGKWYYYHAGVLQIGEQYIGGKWYAFDYYNGAMVTNRIFEGHYYDANGVRAAYTGWKMIQGEWCYFSDDYTLYEGWIRSGNGWYYTQWQYNKELRQEYPVMVADAAIVVDNKLYHFDKTGYCSGPVNKNGWYQAGSDWYYIDNGSVLRNTFRVIDGAGYYFDYDGVMVTNGIVWADTVAGYGLCYVGADGKMVTKPGWLQTEYGWIYIDESGYLCEDGIYKIGGQDYTFRDGLWMK